MPEMSDQIQEGIANLDMNRADSMVSTTSAAMAPNFDYAFPTVQNRNGTVPPTDEEVEATLESARMPVLTSNDADMQLAWAQDALIYAGTSLENEERLQATQPPRACTPRIERQIKADALNVVGFLADQHHPKAEFMRGMWFEFGRFGVVQDKKEAFRCYSRAADRGYARAEYRIGMLYEASNDPAKALKHYHRGVQQSDSASLYRLGMMTLRGQHGQPQDYVKAVDLIKRAAECADENAPQGAYVYGMLLSRQLPQIQVPEGVLPYDEIAARTWIEMAAFQKFAKAQLKMGSAYELAALGCPFDPALSLHYNRLASRQGEAEADMAISKWFLVGHEGLFAKNEELAYTYANRAAQTGLSNAEFAMGYFNELGIHVPRNLDVALSWYKKAANSGNPDASGRIDGLARKQVLSRKDHENVALTRIKSQYGSKRGGRPERFERSRQQAPRMGAISEQLRRGSSPPPPAHPPRSSSTAPYPLDDRPPTVPPVRAPSAAPYPLADGPPMTGGFPAPHRAATAQPERPTTAFTLDPTIRPNSTATTASARQRVASNMGPSPRPLGGRPAPQSRHVSSPHVAGNVMHPATTPTPPPHIPAQPSRIDIGFTAPPDTRTAYRPQGGQHSGAPQQPGSVPPTKFPYPPRSDSRPDLRASASRPDLRPSASRPDLRNTSPSRPRQDVISPPPADLRQDLISPPPQALTPTPNPAAPAKPPPKKGPSTFEEMGVAAQKQESECVSRLLCLP